MIRTIRQRLGAHPVPLQFPLGREDNYIGIIDFLEEKVVVWLEETLGAKFEEFPVAKLWDKAFVDSRPDVAAALKGSAIDRALALNNNITFLREIAVGLIIIGFLMFEPDGLAHRWRQIKTYWKLYPFSH